MKNNVLFIASMILVSLASCTTQRAAQSSTPALIKSSQDTANVEVGHFDGLLSMHPLFTTIQTKEDTYYCYLATNANAICITNDAKFDSTVAAYLPIELNPEKLVVLQSSYFKPFTRFTQEEFEGLKTKFAKLGVKINEYNVAWVFNVATTTWSDYNKLVQNRQGIGTVNTVKTTTPVRQQTTTPTEQRASTRRDEKPKINFDDKTNEKMKRS